ncbi:ABC transporter permease [Methanofollis aquaemaris]|uniref:ABC transporter permease n=1 Tax=Methanofollis aquaemaris TaxID=126734 RepID=A0A8A3S6R1_9EURY|nr:ABC transporter permease subunit [Methanofollis aquaemaris]QSZ67825.1 ABC transporter permease [Methanofollis aquaemaris]
MTANGLRIIAKKEFSDHIRSRRFHLLLGILVVIAAVGMIAGVVQYSKDIADYNAVQTITQSEDLTVDGDLAGMKPSILSVYYQMGILTASIGVVLGIAMGFDLVTREKENKTLKILLSHPIYRDEVINGKALGGLGAIALAMGIVLIVSLAIMSIFGLVPDHEEMVRILISGVVSFLLMFTFFSLSLLMSAVSKDSGSALLYALIVMIVLSSFIPIFTFGPVYSAIFGDPPDLPGTSTYAYQQSSSTYTRVGVTSGDTIESEDLEAYEKASRRYMTQKQMITDIVTLISPTGNYQAVQNVVCRPGGEMQGIACNVIALLAMPAAFFGVAWVRFMREDIR